MSTVGLTDARRSALALLADCRNADDFAIALQAVGRTMLRALHIAKLIDDEGRPNTRGRAALAAPRMTDGQLVVLETLEADGGVYMYMRNSFDACCRKGWITEDGGGLSPAGRTALNNVRAAMGSPDWKEGL